MRNWSHSQFSARPDVEPIRQDVRAGILRHISGGYTVEAWQDSFAPSGERVRTAITWTPIELSFVPTPADPGASTRTAGGTMDPEQQQTTEPSDFTPCPECQTPEACRAAGACALEAEPTPAAAESPTRARSQPAPKRKPSRPARRDQPPAPPTADFVPCADCQTPNGCRGLGACVRDAEIAAGESPPAPEPAPVDAEALVARAPAGERRRIATIHDLAHRLGLERSFADGLVRPGGTGDGVAVRVIARRPDRLVDFAGARIVSTTAQFDIRAAEAPTIAEGDTLEVDGEVFMIQGVPQRDAERLVWTVETRPA